MSEIVKFYEGKNIFITGGTGFIGKLLIEQLLRKCNPNKLYLLVRSKKNMIPDVRIHQLFDEIVFEKMKMLKPNFLDKIEVLSGDLTETNLGLDKQARQKIIENVDIVIHGGATVQFNETIRNVTTINVKGTLYVTKLCKEIKNLKALVYISTITAPCVYSEIEEKFYDGPISCDELIQMVDQLDDIQLNDLRKKLIDVWPNTYTFSKVIAENVIKRYTEGIPTAIVRLASVTNTISEPIPGWSDNLYGINGALMGIQLGSNSVFIAHPNNTIIAIPGDMSVSCILAVVYKTSFIRTNNTVAIYNYAPFKENVITWRQLIAFYIDSNKRMPPNKMIWNTNSYTMISNSFLFQIYSFLRDGIPAGVMDLLLLAMNKTPRAFRIHRKLVQHFLNVSYFTKKNWNYSVQNTKSLWESLNFEDKQMFNFNLKSIDWPRYLDDCHRGVLRYMFKENLKNNESAVKYAKRVNLVQKVGNSFICLIFCYLCWEMFFKTTELPSLMQN